jgi:hypothetical protein
MTASIFAMLQVLRLERRGARTCHTLAGIQADDKEEREEETETSQLFAAPHEVQALWPKNQSARGIFAGEYACASAREVPENPRLCLAYMIVAAAQTYVYMHRWQICGDKR